MEHYLLQYPYSPQRPGRVVAARPDRPWRHAVQGAARGRCRRAGASCVTLLFSFPAFAVLALSLPVTGYWLVDTAGWPLGQTWLLLGSILYALMMLRSVCCWPVVWRSGVRWVMRQRQQR